MFLLCLWVWSYRVVWCFLIVWAAPLSFQTRCNLPSYCSKCKTSVIQQGLRIRGFWTHPSLPIKFPSAQLTSHPGHFAHFNTNAVFSWLYSSWTHPNNAWKNLQRSSKLDKPVLFRSSWLVMSSAFISHHSERGAFTLSWPVWAELSWAGCFRWHP